MRGVTSRETVICFIPTNVSALTEYCSASAALITMLYRRGTRVAHIGTKLPLPRSDTPRMHAVDIGHWSQVALRSYITYGDLLPVSQ